MREKLSNDISSESTLQVHYQKFMYTPGGGPYKVVKGITKCYLHVLIEQPQTIVESYFSPVCFVLQGESV